MKKNINVFLMFVLWGFFLCCGKSPNDPADDRPWCILTDTEPTWSPDGKQIAYVGGGDGIIGPGHKVESGLYIVDLATRKRRFVLPGGGHLYHPHWSPDGEWIVFSLYGQIHRIKPDGDSLIQLTSGGSEFSPRWSPDGQSIAFHRNLGVNGGIFMTNRDGSEEKKLIKWALHPDWFPDGQQLAVYAYDTAMSKSRIARFNVFDSTMEFLTNENTVSKKRLRVSPDGTKILYTAQERGERPWLYLYTVDVQTREVRKITGDVGYSGSWSPDGKYIAYNYPFDGAIYVRDLEADTTIRVSPGTDIIDPDWDEEDFPP